MVRRRLSVSVSALAIALVVSPVRAQDTVAVGSVGLAGHVGTLGLGADVALQVHPALGLRASANFVPFDGNFVEDGVDYQLDWSSPDFLFLADLYPAWGQFRVTAGIMVSPTDYEVSGQLERPTEVGNSIYTPGEVGVITGLVETNTVSPYIGIGLGNAAANRVGFFFDLGVAFHGNPKVSAAADGTAASDPLFQQDLDAEVEELEDDIENVIVYPVLSVGVSLGVGG